MDFPRSSSADWTASGEPVRSTFLFKSLPLEGYLYHALISLDSESIYLAFSAADYSPIHLRSSFSPLPPDQRSLLPLARFSYSFSCLSASVSFSPADMPDQPFLLCLFAS